MPELTNAERTQFPGEPTAEEALRLAEDSERQANNTRSIGCTLDAQGNEHWDPFSLRRFKLYTWHSGYMRQIAEKL